MRTQKGIQFALMVDHPALETLRLWPKGGAWLTDPSLQHISTMSKLKTLTIDFSVLSYDGGLKLLKKLPNLANLDFHDAAISEADLAKLQAELQKVKITFTPHDPGIPDPMEYFGRQTRG